MDENPTQEQQLVERIDQVIQEKGLSHAKFAEEIGVQRANISHIFSGRNQPSLGLVRKVLDRYPEINADWLIRGEEAAQASQASSDEASSSEMNASDKKEQEDLKGIKAMGSMKDRKIERIVIFYDDKTFASYEGM